MKTLCCLGVGIVLISGAMSQAQPWSVAATNAAAARTATPNWSNVVTAATSVPTPMPQPPGLARPTPPMHQPASTFANNPLPPGLLAVDAEQKEFTLAPGEVNAPFVFILTNISSGDILLNYVQTSCGCTTTKIQLPQKIAAGATTEIPLTMNVAGKTGAVIKSVTLHTDKGHKVLLVKTIIPEPTGNPATIAMNRERNQQLASADRQAVFKGECAKCHVEPVIGKVGRELYTAACGICHEAEHRAEMVTDLHNLKITPNAEYWKFFIVNGKPASLMPAFAQAHGGPLSDAQINSLVEYLVKEFPSSKTNALKHANAH